MESSKKVKKIFCPVHGFMEIRPYLFKIIDSYEFQRLRNLKQLGAAHYVFPSATHTRFAHSLAVSHLARKMIESIKKNQPYLNITERDIELVEIGGLIHDLGHGPYSHLWDNYVISDDDDEHEERSCKIFEIMITVYDLNITEEEFKKICQIINPTLDETKHNWYYQIVANKQSQLDVDKMDYIQRDSFYLGNVGLNGNFDRLITEARVITTKEGTMELGWHHRLNYEIFSLFSTRFKLHKLVYTHHAVKSHEYLLLDALKRKYDKLKSGVISFIDLNDNMVTDTIEMRKLNNHKRIVNRNLPVLIGESIIHKKNENYVKLNTTFVYPMRIVNILIDKVHIAFSGGDENPMNKVFYYKTADCGEEVIQGYEIEPTWCSTEFNEVILRCYIMNGSKSANIEEHKKDAIKFWEQYKGELNIK